MRKHTLPVLTILIFLSLNNAFAVEKPVKPDEKKVKVILEKFESYAKKGMKDWQIPGMSIAIVRDDEVIYARGFGVKEAGKNYPVDERTIFQIGSTSKAFTAALMAMVVDENKVNWKDKVVDHFPSFRMYDPWVTREFMVEDLLSQHSGMPAYAGDGQAFAGFDRDHIIQSLRYIKPVTSFRSEFAYVNNLFLVVGKIIEKQTGKGWEENIKERIFQPLGMENSTADAVSYMNGSNAATPHNIQNDKVTPLSKSLDWSYIYGPAGGINSNVLDMAKWLILNINDGMHKGTMLVSKENMNFIHSPKTIARAAASQGKAVYYCESWVYEDLWPYPMIWHNGETSGCHAMVAFWPDAKIGIVILTNLVPNHLAEDLAKKFHDLYFDNPQINYSKESLKKYHRELEESRKTKLKKPEPVAPAMPLYKYVGAYRNDVYGNINVSEKRNGLTITMGPGKAQLILSHWNKDTFSVALPAIGEDEFGFADFSVDEEGNVVKMTIGELNKDGCGEFKRIKQ